MAGNFLDVLVEGDLLGGKLPVYRHVHLEGILISLFIAVCILLLLAFLGLLAKLRSKRNSLISEIEASETKLEEVRREIEDAGKKLAEQKSRLTGKERKMVEKEIKKTESAKYPHLERSELRKWELIEEDLEKS